MGIGLAGWRLKSHVAAGTVLVSMHRGALVAFGRWMWRARVLMGGVQGGCVRMRSTTWCDVLASGVSGWAVI